MGVRKRRAGRVAKPPRHGKGRHGVGSMPRTLGRSDAAILTRIAWGYNEALRVDQRP